MDSRAKAEQERRWQVGDAAFLLDWPHGRRCGVVALVSIEAGISTGERNAVFYVRAVTPIKDHGEKQGRGSFQDPAVLSVTARQEGALFSANYYQLEKPVTER